MLDIHLANDRWVEYCGRRGTNQIQIAERVFQLQREHILLQRQKVQGEFSDIHIADYTFLLKDLVTDEGSSRYPENGELVLDGAIALQLFDLL